MDSHNFYSVIIGTELLNGRREDKHFSFFNKLLRERGLRHEANFVINDNPALMKRVFEMIAKDPKSVMFCFGGIGSTPDDYTRKVAALAFTCGVLKTNQEALKLIKDEFEDEAYPHRVKMANIPQGAKLLENIVNRVPGFYLEDRFFFTPGFPSMAHHMVLWALDNLFEKKADKFSCGFKADCSENDLIDIMEELPEDLELSSLPKIEGDKKTVDIYLAHKDRQILEQWCSFFKKKMDEVDKKYSNEY
ncbi:MAG: molybdopterin-binding protein [Sulfurospirillum sp.]